MKKTVLSCATLLCVIFLTAASSEGQPWWPTRKVPPVAACEQAKIRIETARARLAEELASEDARDELVLRTRLLDLLDFKLMNSYKQHCASFETYMIETMGRT